MNISNLHYFLFYPIFEQIFHSHLIMDVIRIAAFGE